MQGKHSQLGLKGQTMAARPRLLPNPDSDAAPTRRRGGADEDVTDTDQKCVFTLAVSLSEASGAFTCSGSGGGGTDD